MLEQEQIVRIVEAALLASDQPLTVERLLGLFVDGEADRQQVRDALTTLGEACNDRGYELKQVASGYRFQVRQTLNPWISRMWEERPPRYSRALLETLALIAYKQPVTRGDIEDIRGVAVSSNIMRTLLERDWIRVVGYREVPGRPALYATTKAFLDYFNLQSLNDLPPMAEIRALTEPHVEDLIQAGPEYAEGLDTGESENDDGLRASVTFEVADSAQDSAAASEHEMEDSDEAEDGETVRDEADDFETADIARAAEEERAEEAANDDDPPHVERHY
jgi:segregation and condensation protein B